MAEPQEVLPGTQPVPGYVLYFFFLFLARPPPPRTVRNLLQFYTKYNKNTMCPGTIFRTIDDGQVGTYVITLQYGFTELQRQRIYEETI